MPRHTIHHSEIILLQDIEVQMRRKNVKNLNLRVYPAEERVVVSVPKLASKKVVEDFLNRKYDWIKKKLSVRPTIPNPQQLQYVTGEEHFFWGKKRKLLIVEKEEAPQVTLPGPHTAKLQVRPGSKMAKIKKVVKEFYRAELKREIPKLIEKWEPVMNVKVSEFGVKQMKTRWGSCNIRDRRIWLNLELAKKRPELLEYVVVHEMTHLLERLHNKRFYGLMAQFLPNWKQLEQELNGKKRC